MCARREEDRQRKKKKGKKKRKNKQWGIFGPNKGQNWYNPPLTPEIKEDLGKRRVHDRKKKKGVWPKFGEATAKNAPKARHIGPVAGGGPVDGVPKIVNMDAYAG